MTRGLIIIIFGLSYFASNLHVSYKKEQERVNKYLDYMQKLTEDNLRLSNKLKQLEKSCPGL